jgi:hypothetical protein
MSKRKEFHVAREMRVRLSAKGEFLGSVSRSSGEFFLATEVLLLLQEIQRARVVDEGLASRLRAALGALTRASPEAGELGGLVEELHGAGLLVAKGARAPKNALLQDGFGDPWIQWAMLADAPRCRAYGKAIVSAVDDASVVVDVGAGTGLLGALALKAGARKVFAIEETASARSIAPLFKELGLPASRPAFELFQGNSTEAPLPRDATVVVSELFGNDPFCEGVLPTLRDVGARLTPGRKVRWVPQALEVFVEIVGLTGSAVHARVAALAAAREARPLPAKGDPYLEFLQASARALPLEALSFAVPLQGDELVRAGEAVSLGVVRLDPPSSPVVRYAGETTVAFEPAQAGRAPLVALVWFRVRLDARTTLSNHPLEDDACEHWSPLVVPLAPIPATDGGRARGAKRTLKARWGLSPFEDALRVSFHAEDGTPLGAR